MTERRKTRQVKAGNVLIGGGAPVTVQSMLNVPSTDIQGSVRQAVALECGFTGGSLSVTCFLQVRLLVLDVLALALRYGLRAYRIYRSQTAPQTPAADGGEAEA